MFIVAQSVLEAVYLTNTLIVFHAIYQRKTLYEVHTWSFYIKTYTPFGDFNTAIASTNTKTS
jgi:hypothetical protein